MRERLFAIFLLAAAGLLSHATANAEVMRCSDASGNTLYTDSTCPAGMHATRVTTLPQSCTTQDCDRRREREINEAHERLRAEKQELAVYTTQRHKREIEDSRLDEARYEAELRSAQAMQSPPDETVYPAYPITGVPLRCGTHCLSLPHRRHPSVRSAGNVEEGHHRLKDPGNHMEVRAAGNEPRRALTGKRVTPIDRVAGR